MVFSRFAVGNVDFYDPIFSFDELSIYLEEKL